MLLARLSVDKAGASQGSGYGYLRWRNKMVRETRTKAEINLCGFKDH